MVCCCAIVHLYGTHVHHFPRAHTSISPPDKLLRDVFGEPDVLEVLLADKRLQRSVVARCSTPLFYAFSAVLDDRTSALQTVTTNNYESVAASVAASTPAEEGSEKEKPNDGGPGQRVASASEAGSPSSPAPSLNRLEHRLRSKPPHNELRCALQAAMLSMAPGRATIEDVWENLQAAHGTTDLPAGIQGFVVATRQVMNYRLAQLVSSESNRRSAEMVLSMIPGEPYLGAHTCIRTRTRTLTRTRTHIPCIYDCAPTVPSP